MTAPEALARKTLGGGSLWLFAVGASSPMTVLVGGLVATYAATGVVGVPLSFPLITIALGLLSVGFVAMSRHVPHAAPGYALLAHGLGRSFGMAGAVLALLAYNAIQVSLYGLVGVTLSGMFAGPWWLWAALVWLAIAGLGVSRVTVNARLLATALLIEICVIVMFDLAAFTDPASGAVSFVPLAPSSLFVDGVGGVFALGMAAFVGWEAAPVYAEEARAPGAVARATFGAVLFLGVFYMFSAWALALAVGPDHVVDAARDPAAGLPFSVLLGAYGSLVPALAGVLVVTSVIAAMVSFHSGVARYVYALGREQVLPPAFARLSQGVSGGSPVGGSLVQSAIAAIVVAVFALAGADPITVMFTWLSTIGALGVLTLMVACSLAAVRFFKAGGGTREPAFVRATAPTLGILSGAAIVAVMVGNISSLLGVDPGSALTWVIPGLVVAAVLAGLCWGVLLRRHRPSVYAGIGRGRPHPLAVRDQRLSALKL